MRADVELNEDGMFSGFSVPGVGEAKGTTLKNPVTGEDHYVAIELDQGASSGSGANAARARSRSRPRDSPQVRGLQLDFVRL